MSNKRNNTNQLAAIIQQDLQLLERELPMDCIGECIPLSIAEKETLNELVTIRVFKKGTIILREGQISTNCYSIISGCVRQYYLVNGIERTTFFYTENQTIYAMRGSSENTPSNHYLACVEDTAMSIMTKENERELFRRFPRFEALSRIALEEELGNYQQMLANYIIKSSEERYLHLLENRPDLLDRVPHYHLASYLGVKPESLSRIRRRIMRRI